MTCMGHISCSYQEKASLMCLETATLGCPGSRRARSPALCASCSDALLLEICHYMLLIRTAAQFVRAAITSACKARQFQTYAVGVSDSCSWRRVRTSGLLQWLSSVSGDESERNASAMQWHWRT